MAVVHVKLEYPLSQVKEPIIYHLVKDYQICPNILRAKIDVHEGGTLDLELEGEPTQIQKGISFLRDLGIGVTEA